ncbi:MAG TPA: FtsX-like permease family protein, partial [Chryseolinea sp.]|nr:FtsX-like permease family protein [Chryseolinea sp.]
THSHFRSKLNYWFQVIQYARPFAIRKSLSNSSNNYAMFKHYTKIAWRNMLRDKTHFAINTLGLALSMFCAMLVILWIQDELSYENFFPQADQVYRLVQDQQYDNGEVFKVAANPGILPVYLKENYPGIIHYTRLRPLPDKVLVQHSDTKFYEDVSYVDSTFFQVFQLPFLVGNPLKCLEDPNSIVITEKMAEKYFGSDWREKDVLNESLELNVNEKFAITAVIKDLPANTHLKIDFLLPFRKLYQYGWYLDWGNNYYYAYFLLDKGVNAEELSKQFTAFGKSRDDLTDILYLQALKDIHLYSDFDIDVYGSTELQYPYVNNFMAVALSIIVIACINFMNLSTARSEKRAKEIGLRKTVGSQRFQIINQLLGESVLITMIAFVIAIAGVMFVLPYFNQISDKSILLSIDQWPLGVSFFFGALVIGLFAGSYPAFYLSAFNPVQVLKGRLTANGGTTFRRTLVVVQFSVTIILLLGTGVIYKQFQYFMEKDLGYTKDLLMYMPVRGEIFKNYNGFKNELVQHQNIKNLTYSSDIPTYTVHSFGGFDWDGKNPDDDVILHSFSVGTDYVETLGLELLEGRDFSATSPADSSNYILNEEALRLTGLKSPIGKRFVMWEREGKIIGIVKDFNFKSLHQKVEPLVIRMNPAWNTYLMVKLKPDNTSGSLKVIESAWKKYNPDYPFEFHFVDEQYENLYKSEQRMASVFDYFTFFTLFISCLGLIGLINHMIEKKKKEISIRKVLGASVSGILMLLSREYIKLILIAIVISVPLAGYLVYNWLENYAYKIETQWWMYVLPGALVVGVVLLLVLGQTLKTARQNPVDNLRYE